MARVYTQAHLLPPACELYDLDVKGRDSQPDFNEYTWIVSPNLLRGVATKRFRPPHAAGLAQRVLMAGVQHGGFWCGLVVVLCVVSCVA